MTRKFKDIKIGDELYEAYRYQPISENISVLTVVNITEESPYGLTFRLCSNENWNYNFPIFKDELKIDNIVLTDKILATSLETLKQAIYKDIAELNKEEKRSAIYAKYKI